MSVARLFFILILIPSISVANMAADYENARHYIQSSGLSQGLQASINEKTIPATINHSPDEAKYYRKPKLISNDVATDVSTPNSVAKLVHDSAFARPKTSVNDQSAEIQSAKKIQENSSSIVDGTYKDCDKKVVNDTTYTEKSCLTSHPYQFSCVKTLNVHVEQQWVNKTESINLLGHLYMSGSSNARLSTDVSEGEITGISMHVHDSSNPWSCFQNYGLKINGITIGWYHAQCGRRLGDLQFGAGGLKIPFSHRAITLTLVGGGLSGYVSGSLSLAYQEEKKRVVKQWGSSCASIPSSCQVSATQCLESNVTKNIDGIDVTAPCWKAVETLQCGGKISRECQALKTEGCTQTSSICSKYELGLCSAFSETWACPSTKQIGQGVSCGGQFYCLDGSCQPTSHEINKDFGKSISELDAVSEAGKEVKDQHLSPGVDPNNVRIFTGKTAECSKDAAGVDCCADSGWGKDVLGTCTDQEKALGQAKERGVVIRADGYCKTDVAGLCVDYRYRYCIFPNKLSYDVQQYGRKDQLHRDFGRGKETDCSGLTPAELGRIDFSKINFSNITEHLKGKKKEPSVSDVAKATTNHINDGSSKEFPYFAKGLLDE